MIKQWRVNIDKKNIACPYRFWSLRTDEYMCSFNRKTVTCSFEDCIPKNGIIGDVDYTEIGD